MIRNTYLEDFNQCTHGPWQTAGNDIQFKVVNRVLYFQCSHSASDWQINLDIAVVPYKNMEEEFLVHRGFLNAWQSVRDEVMKLDFVRIVGYSHGGALAILAHEDYLYKYGHQIETVVFGCPKVLFWPSESIQERFTNVTRISNAWDIVTLLPPPLYAHVGSVTRLSTFVPRPSSVARWQWASGHTREMYRARLT